MSTLRRTALPHDLRRLFGMSAAGHLGLLVVIILIGAFGRTMRPSPPQTFIPTKLVRLGEKRPEHLLPKIEAQRPPPPKPAVKIAAPTPDAPTTAARPQAPEAALDRAKDTAKVSSALDRLKRVADDAEPLAGDASGVENGDVSDVKQAIEGNKYVAEIDRCLKTNFVVQGMDRARTKGRQTEILMRINADGKLFGHKILKGSGNAALDRGVERALLKCGKFSKPPDFMRQDLAEEGIEITFVPVP